MVEVSIQVDRDTLNNLRAQMDRLVKELGKTPEDATRMGALALLKSLKTATKIAPARRKVRVDKTWKKKSRDASGNQRFLMQKFDRKTGAEKDVQIWAPSLAEAKQSRLAVLHYRGLAKASWGWSAQRLFPSQKVGYQGRKPRREVFAVTQRGKGNLFPTHVGMIRRGTIRSGGRESFPHARGDDPAIAGFRASGISFSPRTWG